MTYYVADLARYVLVEAPDEATARARGEAAIRAAYSAAGRSGVTAAARTVRPPTPDEVGLMRWHDDMVAAEAAHRGRS